MPQCEKYKFELRKPCSCEKCSFHIVNNFAYNCMKYYLNNFGTSIQVTDAAELLGITRSQYRQNIKKAIDESRAAKLDEVIGRGNEFEYVPDSNICVVCGKDAFAKTLKFNGLSYCSKSCLKRLPVKIASLMNRLGVDEYTLFYALVSVFSGEKICELLGLDYSQLKRWVKDLCGIDLKAIYDVAPTSGDISLDKLSKIIVKNKGNSVIFNNDPVFEKVDCFLAM